MAASLARQSAAVAFLVATFCPCVLRAQGSGQEQYLYCKQCGAPLLPCSHLEHKVSPLAQGEEEERICGERHRVQRVPHTLGTHTVLVHSAREDEIDASGASFVHFPNIRNVTGVLTGTSPAEACQRWLGRPLEGRLAVVLRGACTFHAKARNVQHAGAVGMIVVDTEAGHVAGFTMSGPEPEESGVFIPAVIVAKEDGQVLLDLARGGVATAATIAGLARRLVVARHHRGLMLEPIPGQASPAQREVSWFPGYNYRLSKCRTCNVHVGFFFNRSRVPGVPLSDVDSSDEGGGGDVNGESSRYPGIRGAGSSRPPRGPGITAAGEDKAVGGAAGSRLIPNPPAADFSAENEMERPMYHALFRDAFDDGTSVRKMEAGLHASPVL